MESNLRSGVQTLTGYTLTDNIGMAPALMAINTHDASLKFRS